MLDELYNSHEIIGTDLGKILRVLTNISEYLYNKYGEYSSIGKEVDIMVTTLYNPVVAKKAKKEIALNMLKENIDVNIIERCTGLSSEDILKLKEGIEKQT